MAAEQEGNIQRIYFSRSEWTEIGRRYLREVIAGPDKLRSVLSDIRQVADELIRFSKELCAIDVAFISPERQLDLLGKYHARHFAVWTLGMIPNVLELENSFLADYLKDWLKKKGLDAGEVMSAFQELSTPRELSMAQKEEREMLSLARAANPEADLEKHRQTYNWLHFGWIGPSLSERYFIGVHEGLYKQGDAKRLLEKLLERDEQLVENKKRWIERLKAPTDIADIFRLLEELLFIKAHRMDALYMSYEAVQPLLKKIAREHYLSLQQVYALYYDWLVEMIKNDDVDAVRINNIGRYAVQYFDGRQIHLLVGEEARELIRPIKETLPTIEKMDKLKGECAFPGKALGRVCLVNKAEEMKKFKEGDILVSNVTDPSLLPIMKKASAFVTNQGGLTCHAAIVARELKIPCVIGTKIATRILKDGDMVEVDAEKGKVRVIK